MTSNSRRRYSNATGRMAEVRFVRQLLGRRDCLLRSHHIRSIHEHIDYWLAMSGQGKKWGVDVKGNLQMRSG